MAEEKGEKGRREKERKESAFICSFLEATQMDELEEKALKIYPRSNRQAMK